MRGEYRLLIIHTSLPWELPPRARRIPMVLIILLYLPGTTSACAENTLFTAASLNAPRNYLRVRGEYTPSDWTVTCQPELPPRARRIQSGCAWCGSCIGTTSACAENTSSDSTGSGTPGNYLRVRGEYCVGRHWRGLTPELPPRARRIPSPACVAALVNGTTSACAENTFQ